MICFWTKSFRFINIYSTIARKTQSVYLAFARKYSSNEFHTRPTLFQVEDEVSAESLESECTSVKPIMHLIYVSDDINRKMETNANNRTFPTEENNTSCTSVVMQSFREEEIVLSSATK